MCGNEIPFDEKDIKGLRELCVYLEKELDSQTTQYENKCLEEIKILPEGEYILNIDMKSQELFTKTSKMIKENHGLEFTLCPYQPKNKGINTLDVPP